MAKFTSQQIDELLKDGIHRPQAASEDVPTGFFQQQEQSILNRTLGQAQTRRHYSMRQTIAAAAVLAVMLGATLSLWNFYGSTTPQSVAIVTENTLTDDNLYAMSTTDGDEDLMALEDLADCDDFINNF